MHEDFFAKRIADLRNKKGVSARDMSLSIGQSANYINKIENRKAFPSMLLFFYICDYFNISPKDFFDGENNSPEELNKLVENLRKLDDKSLSHITGLVDELIK